MLRRRPVPLHSGFLAPEPPAIMNPAARARAHPFTAFIEPRRCMLAHDRLSELHLERHVHHPLDRPPLFRTGDASQEAFDAAIEHEVLARAAAKENSRRIRHRMIKAKKSMR